MNKEETKKKWAEALRSGKYQQGGYALRSDDDKFCCLGVLIDIVDPDLWEEEPQEVKAPTNAPHDYMTVYKVRDVGPNIGGFTALPDNIREALGITESNERTLMQMNDVRGEPFGLIADYIEGL